MEAKVKWIDHDLPIVASQLSTKSQQLQQFHREGLLMQLKALRFLARQGIAIRGHNETEGNLQQLLLTWSEGHSALQSWIKETDIHATSLLMNKSFGTNSTS